MFLCDRYTYGGHRRPFHITADDLTTHAFIVGGSGVGKSTLIVNLLSDLCDEGGSFAFLDPHGTSADLLLDLIPKRRTRDLIYLAPRDLAHPVGLNVLAGVEPDDRHLVASNVVESFRNQYADSWGPRLDWYLYNCVRTLLELDGATLLWIPRLLTDRPWRRELTRHLPPELASFWDDEFDKKDARLREEAISPIQNKVGRIVTSPPLALMLGQRKSAFSAADVMDSRKILIADLSGIGTAEANILGSLLVTHFQVEAPKRSTTDPFVLALDEAPRFTTESLGIVLSEGRKFGLGLLLACQYLGQWPKITLDAIFGNSATTITFRLGGPDAKVMEEQLGGAWPRQALVDLPRFETVVRSPQPGHLYDSFRALTRPPKARRGRRDILIRVSKERYGKSRRSIERAIRRDYGRLSQS
jgi:hypothetical protein